MGVENRLGWGLLADQLPSFLRFGARSELVGLSATLKVTVLALTR